MGDEKRNKFGKSNTKKPKAEGADGKEEVEVKQEEEFTLPKGSVLKLTGLGGEITREDIKEVLKDQCSVNIDKDGGDIAFVTYEKGEAEAKIRFKNEDGAKAPAAAWVAKDKVEIKGMTIVGSLQNEGTNSPSRTSGSSLQTESLGRRRSVQFSLT